MLNRERLYRLVGESAREVGILVLVFGPLDELIQPARTDLTAIIFFAIIGLLFAALGIMLEAGN